MNGLYNHELLLMDANLGNLGVLGPELFLLFMFTGLPSGASLLLFISLQDWEGEFDRFLVTSAVRLG